MWYIGGVENKKGFHLKKGLKMKTKKEQKSAMRIMARRMKAGDWCELLGTFNITKAAQELEFDDFLGWAQDAHMTLFGGSIEPLTTRFAFSEANVREKAGRVGPTW